MKTLVTFGSQTITGQIRATGKVGVTPDALGNPLVGMKVPGYTGDAEGGFMVFRPENMTAFAAKLQAAVKSSGPDPLQIAMDSMTRNSDGQVSFRLSNAPRARTITLGGEEANEFAGFMIHLVDQVQAQIAAAAAAEEAQALADAEEAAAEAAAAEDEAVKGL